MNILEGTPAYMAPEQTGRFGGTIDERSDLYSLGATFFHLFAGRPPYILEDHLELMHSHIARPTPRLDTLVPSVPTLICDIVDKLLAKNADDRYQKASDLLADLEDALSEYKMRGKITHFTLRGAADGKLVFPRKLYGRNNEAAAILDAYERVANGNSEIILVKGFSGIGKTEFVKTLNKPVSQRKGVFVSGKFDQYQKNIPYSALIRAIQEFFSEILTQPEDKVGRFRKLLKDAVGANGQVIADVIPEVGHLLGPLQPIASLPPLESLNRFNFVFERFFCVLGQPEHPLAIFLDDLQWIDRSTLDLITSIMRGRQIPYFLLIGAYRDNEVDDNHILYPILKGHKNVKSIELQSLSKDDVSEMIADTLVIKETKDSSFQELCTLVHARTEGNPFVIKRFLMYLNDQGILSYKEEEDRWEWSIDAVRSSPLGEGAVELLIRRMRALPQATTSMLKVAACMGTIFDIETLSHVFGDCIEVVIEGLWPAICAELIGLARSRSTGQLQSSPPGAVIASREEDLAETIQYHEVSRITYAFIHDRIQQAAWTLTGEGERARIHGFIAQLLIKKYNSQALDDRVFEIIEHLLYGYDESEQSRPQLLDFLLKGSIRAHESSAYQPSQEWAEKGIELILKNPVISETEMDRLHTLYYYAASSAYLNNDFDRMQQHIDALKLCTDDPVKRGGVLEIQLSSMVSRNQLKECLQLALEILPDYNINLPHNPSKLTISNAFSSVLRGLGSRTIGDLADAQEMQDATALSAMNVLTRIASVTYVAAPNLFPMVAIAQADLTIKFGITAISAHTIAILGVFFSGSIDDLDSAYTCAMTAEKILARFVSSRTEGRARYTAAVYLRVWKEPIAKIWNLCLAIEKSCLENGDLEYAGWAAFMRVTHGLFSGQSLIDIEPQARNNIIHIEQIKQTTAKNYASISHQLMLNLMGKTEKPSELSGEAYDSDTMMLLHKSNNDMFGYVFAHLHRLVLYYHFGMLEEAFASTNEVATHLEAISGLIHVAIYHQYAALTCLNLAAQAEGSLRLQLLNQADVSVMHLRHFASHQKENHAHRVALLDAERALIDGQRGVAIESYHEAIKSAEENGFLLELGLCHERACLAWVEWGNSIYAKAHAVEARFNYLQHGSDALARRMEQLVGQQIFDQATNAIEPSVMKTVTKSNASIDLELVLKASQAISQELTVDTLLTKLLRISIESGGAEKGALIIVNEKGEPYVEVRYTTDMQSERLHILLENSPDVCIDIVRFALRSGQLICLSNASTDSVWQRSLYIQTEQQKSILCIPILRSGDVVGAIYLENRSSPGVFDSQRTEVLQAIAVQAAISINNALLVQDLEERVALRTNQLEKRNLVIREMFGRYVSNEVMEELLAKPMALHRGGELREMTILFADLRGFSTICSQSKPEDVVSLINNYLGIMADVIQDYDGTIDEVLGDGILVLFGAPLPQPDHRQAAISCALAMQLAMPRVNYENDKQNLPHLSMGIGICSGDVVVGTIGSKLRAKYAVVGNPMNLASRIQSLTTGGQILAAEATIKDIEKPLTFDGDLSFEPKGYQETLKLYSITGIGGEHPLSLPVNNRMVRDSNLEPVKTTPKKRATSKPKADVNSTTAGDTGKTTKTRRSPKKGTSSNL
jgi:predicted ATPase/class 3 adenylate cyclase